MANTMRDKMGLWNAKCVRQTLEQADLWNRMVVAGYVQGSGDLDVKDMSPQKMKRNMLESMYKRAVDEGNTAAMRTILPLLEEKEQKDTWSMRINIVPYTIQDKSLRQIVLDADEGPIGDILHAWVERCRIDGFSEPVMEAADKLLKDWLAEAKKKFKDAVDPSAETVYDTDVADEVMEQLKGIDDPFIAETLNKMVGPMDEAEEGAAEAAEAV